MVVLSFTITDNKGHYINGLHPRISNLEDEFAEARHVSPRRQASYGRGRRRIAQADSGE